MQAERLAETSAPAVSVQVQTVPFALRNRAGVNTGRATTPTTEWVETHPAAKMELRAGSGAAFKRAWIVGVFFHTPPIACN